MDLRVAIVNLLLTGRKHFFRETEKKLISFISVKNLSSCTLKIITQNRLSLHKSATDLKVSLTEEKRDLLDVNPNPKQDGRFVASFGKCK